MLDVLNKTETANELPLDTTTKRERVERELRNNSARSDREIGRVCGVDGKTVGAARERLGMPSPLGNTPDLQPSREDLLKAAAPHIDWNGPAMQESLAKVVAFAEAEDVRDALGIGDDDETGMYWGVPSQAAIECRVLKDGGVEIWQEGQHGPDEASIIHVAAGNAVMLARHLLYAAGFPNVGMYVHVRGEGNVDLNDGDLGRSFRDANKPKPGYGTVR